MKARGPRPHLPTDVARDLYFARLAGDDLEIIEARHGVSRRTVQRTRDRVARVLARSFQGRVRA
ncbi:MAG TPA: hypothetical protein VH062_07650 [Polyangiaceae bacterium]|nr:hypothetical protein [Polyangiaceae bacterium]